MSDVTQILQQIESGAPRPPHLIWPAVVVSGSRANVPHFNEMKSILNAFIRCVLSVILSGSGLLIAYWAVANRMQALIPTSRCVLLTKTRCMDSSRIQRGANGNIH